MQATDPCLYILRFASKLEFGAKTQQVANTALRLVQRMKRDSIHSGRRPSGLCGAALLIASRLHEFSRSIGDIVKVVKVHESTMRKRLIEFGDTPSSALTLEEFMMVDLEEEQDPPSFKAARKKDKERLQKLMEEETDNFSDLQKQIENHLEQTKIRSALPRVPSKLELHETKKFIQESTLGTIHQIIEGESEDGQKYVPPKELGPNIESIGLPSSLDDTSNAPQPQSTDADFDLTFDDIDDEELDAYIMTDIEFEMKNELWNEVNAPYLQKLKEKEELLQKEREEGKPEKKPRKRPTKKTRMGPANSAGEAIEKIIQEKKISSKINYEVLKNLNSVPASSEVVQKDDVSPAISESIKRRRLSSISSHIDEPVIKVPPPKARKLIDVGLPFVADSKPSVSTKIEKKEELEPMLEKIKADHASEEEEEEDDFYEEQDRPDESANEMGVLQMLKQHHEDEVGEDEYGYDDYGYEEDY